MILSLINFSFGNDIVGSASFTFNWRKNLHRLGVNQIYALRDDLIQPRLRGEIICETIFYCINNLRDIFYLYGANGDG